MDLQLSITSTLVLLGLCILIFALYAGQRPQIQGALPFAYLCLASTVYVIGYSFELASTTLATIDFWSKLQYIGLAFIPYFWISLSFHFNPHQIWTRLWFKGFILILPTLTLLFRWFSPWIPFHYAGISLFHNGFFNVLQIAKGPWYYIHYGYFILASLLGLWRYTSLLKKAQPSSYPHHQAKYLILASVVPLVSLLLNTLSLFPLGLDSGPFITGFNFIFFGIAVFKYHFIQVLPLSRDQVFLVMRDAVLVLDTFGKLIDFNPIASTFFECLKGPHNNCKDPQLEAILKLSHASYQFPNGYPIEYETPYGKRHYLIHKATLIKDDIHLGTTLVISDQTRHIQSIKTLEHAAHYDGLTGIYNRRYTLECIRGKIKDHPNASGGLMIIDIDHFKQINDTYGHLVGDVALVAVAKGIQAQLSADAIFGRFGGEEFVVFLHKVTEASLLATANQIVAHFSRQPLAINDHLLRLTLSIGTSFQDDLAKTDNCDIDAIIARADDALYKAKHLGRNQVHHE